MNGLKTNSNSYGRETLNIVKNRTPTPSATWTEDEHYTFSVDGSWEHEMNYFRDAIMKNKPIETCGIEDAIRLMTMVDKVYAQ